MAYIHYLPDIDTQIAFMKIKNIFRRDLFVIQMNDTRMDELSNQVHPNASERERAIKRAEREKHPMA